MTLSRSARRAGLIGILLFAALLAACNVGVGLSASIPAPWGQASLAAGTSFPTHPGW